VLIDHPEEQCKVFYLQAGRGPCPRSCDRNLVGLIWKDCVGSPTHIASIRFLTVEII